MNSWNRLPADIQSIIDGLGPAGKEHWYASVSGPDADSHLVDALDYIRQNGELITLSPEETERWKQAMRPSLELALDAVEAKSLPGRKFFSRLQELVWKEI